MSDETDTEPKARSVQIPATALASIISLAIGGGIGTVGSGAYLQKSIDKLSEQVEKIGNKVEHLSDGRITRLEVDALMDKRAVVVDAHIDKLEERLRALETKTPH